MASMRKAVASLNSQPAFIAARVAKVRAAMREAGRFDALWVTSFVDVSWLTGFEGDDSYALISDERILLISDEWDR